MTSPRTQRQAGPLQAITLLLPATLSTMAIVVLVPILPQLLAYFHSVPDGEYWVPMVLTVPSVCLVIASPLAGFAADLVGRRRILVASMAIYAVLGVLPIFLDNLWAILASRVGVGLVEAVILTVSTALIGDFFKGEERDHWLGYQIAVASISATLLIFIGGQLGKLGWRGPFAMYATAVILMAAILAFTWEPQAEKPDGEGSGPPLSWAGFPWPRLAGICTITLLASVLFYLTQVQLPLLLQLHGVTAPGTSGTLQALASLGVPVGTAVFRFTARVAPVRLLTVTFTVFGLSFVGMGLAPTVPFLIAVAIVNQIAAGITLPTLLTWAMRGLPFHLRGRGTGIWQGTFSVGQFLMPILVTLLSKTFGGLFAAVTAIGAMALLVAAIFVVAQVAQHMRRRAFGADQVQLL